MMDFDKYIINLLETHTRQSMDTAPKLILYIFWQKSEIASEPMKRLLNAIGKCIYKGVDGHNCDHNC